MSSPSNRAGGEPEVPPEIPPEYADAYLAGFRRGLGGLEPGEVTDPVEPDPAPVAPGTQEPVRDAVPDVVPATETVTEARADEPSEPEDAEAPEAGPQPGSTDLEWLFDRRESGPPGWSDAPAPSVAADSTSELHQDAEPAPSSGATVVAGQGPRSPWPLLGAFVVVLLLLMLLAYLGGMAFSTIMNR